MNTDYLLVTLIAFLVIVVVFEYSLYEVFATVTLNNTNIEMIHSNINITTAITMESLLIEGDGFTTRPNSDYELRKYTHDRTASSIVYNLEWQSLDTIKAQFNVTSIVTDARGNVTGTILDHIDLDDVTVAFVFDGTKNIVIIGSSNQVEYFFPPRIFNTITLALNSPTFERLGGVFAITCPANFTLTGLFTNGTFLCTSMNTFFP